MEWRRDGFTLTTERARVDLDVVHRHLVDSYWAKGIPFEVVPDVQGLRRWSLLTRDAHSLYARVGFTLLARPERWMERWTPDAYAGSQAETKSGR